MNEPSSNAGGVGGLGDNGAGDPAHQDVHDSFGANPAAAGGSGGQDPNAMTASICPLFALICPTSSKENSLLSGIESGTVLVVEGVLTS